MAKGHVEEGWQGYRLVCLPASASEVQVSETRKGFYAGAWFLLTHLVKVLDPSGDEPTEEDFAVMESIAAELRAFAESGGVEERADRVRAGQSQGKPADEVFERLAKKGNDG